MRRTKLALFALTALALGACARPTPYEPASADNGGHGYTVQQIEANRFRVNFTGNTLTPRGTVESYMLYNAAEVTVNNGFDYFLLVDRATDKSTGYTNVGDGVGGFGYGGWGRHRGFGGFGGDFDYSRSYPDNSFDAAATILCFRGKKPADPNAYDARDVLARLAPTVARPTTQPAMGPAQPAPAGNSRT